MNRINQLFNEKKKDILSIYFCAGYPTLTSTAEIIQTLETEGVDLVEIGIPFSDPMADGPVIQQASTEALKNGMSLKVLFEQLKEIRSSVKIPLIIMGYLNPIMQYGFEQFCQSCQACGIDGVIIPDLPFQVYLDEYKVVAERYNVKVIMLITPETNEERVRLIDEQTDGFIYMVSSASTTGAQDVFGKDTINYFRRINETQLKHPCLIGFGISNKSTFRCACENAAGAIIGSKFVRYLSEFKTCKGAISKILADIGKKN